MAVISALHRKFEMPFLKNTRKADPLKQSHGTLEVLDLDFDKLFISVEDFNESDIDPQGNLILEHFVNDQMLAEEGIPLTCEDMRNIFSTASNLTNQENLKAG